MVARLTLAGIRSISHPRRHHQLRDARARPADPRLRPRQAHAAASPCAARRAGEKLADPRRQGAHARTSKTSSSPTSPGRSASPASWAAATTEMADATRNVLIEAATFDPVTIARTARRHKLPSEASRRFERGVDPEIAARRRPRVADLMVDLRRRHRRPRGRRAARRGDELARRSTCPSASSTGLIGVDYTRDEMRRRARDDRRGRPRARGRLRRRAARRGAPTSPTSGRSPKRSPASRATTASRRCCRRRRRAAA